MIVPEVSLQVRQGRVGEKARRDDVQGEQAGDRRSVGLGQVHHRCGTGVVDQVVDAAPTVARRWRSPRRALRRRGRRSPGRRCRGAARRSPSAVPRRPTPEHMRSGGEERRPWPGRCRIRLRSRRAWPRVWSEESADIARSSHCRCVLRSVLRCVLLCPHTQYGVFSHDRQTLNSVTRSTARPRSLRRARGASILRGASTRNGPQVAGVGPPS